LTEINWQVEACIFGYALIVTYNKVLVAVEFNDSDYPLIVGLANNFNNKDAKFTQFGIDKNLIDDIMLVIDKGELRHIPYRLLGTPFQTKVWQAIDKIPYGQTMTYGQIATAIGHPKAHRAVGTACNHNHLGVIVPCHRVVPADGSMGKYAWGEVMKNQLLKREGVDVNKFKFVMRKPKKFASMHDEICWHEDKKFFKEIYEVSRSTNKI
jgi:AraC family transcriptional regulator, regulatory protein of adaptative response / methylated-DNA-[protein]-cysteine methyltransferase